MASEIAFCFYFTTELSHLLNSDISICFSQHEGLTQLELRQSVAFCISFSHISQEKHMGIAPPTLYEQSIIQNVCSSP